MCNITTIYILFWYKIFIKLTYFEEAPLTPITETSDMQCFTNKSPNKSGLAKGTLNYKKNVKLIYVFVILKKYN